MVESTRGEAENVNKLFYMWDVDMAPGCESGQATQLRWLAQRSNSPHSLHLMSGMTSRRTDVAVSEKKGLFQQQSLHVDLLHLNSPKMIFCRSPQITER